VVGLEKLYGMLAFARSIPNWFLEEEGRRKGHFCLFTWV